MTTTRKTAAARKTAQKRTQSGPAAKKAQDARAKQKLQTIRESVELITGYDEQEIEQRWGAEFDDLDGTKWMRALIFATAKRTEKLESYDEAYDRVMSMSQAEANDYFGEDDPEAEGDFDPDNPVSAEGNGDSPDAS